MPWSPRLYTINPFPREALLNRDFDPLHDIPQGSDNLLLPDAWGLFILRHDHGSKIQRSMEPQEWVQVFASIGKAALANLPYREAVEGLSDRELGILYQTIKENTPIAIDHLAAVRGILSPDGEWIWCIGIVHDHILVASGHHQLLARYRNQRTFLPLIEYEPDVNPLPSLLTLLKQGIRPEDTLNIRGANFHAMSIADALEQLGT